MPRKKFKKKLAESKFGDFDNHEYDIISCALRNDFIGVDKSLEIDPDVINLQRHGSGVTALMAASGRGLEEMVDHLLAKPGLNLDIVDRNGKNALFYARIFPNIVEKIMVVRHPGVKWQEPKIQPI